MASKTYSILGIGAHIDDCWLGCGATALKALKRGHKVTFITAVTNFRRWPVLAGRDAEAHAHLDKLTRESGIDIIRLGHDYMRLQNTPALVEQLTQQLIALRPDILFYHDPNESNQDHNALGDACRIAAVHGECFTPEGQTPGFVGELYRYTTGWQSEGFSPDTIIDVSDTIFEALRYCSSFDELYANGKHPSKQITAIDHLMDNATVDLTSHSRFKFAQSILFSGSNGYAEAFKSYRPVPVQHRKLIKAVAD